MWLDPAIRVRFLKLLKLLYHAIVAVASATGMELLTGCQYARSAIRFKENAMSNSDIKYLVFTGRYSAQVNGDRRNVMFITVEEAVEQEISFTIAFKQKPLALAPDGQASGWKVQLKTTSRTFEVLSEAMAYRDRYNGSLTKVLL